MRTPTLVKSLATAKHSMMSMIVITAASAACAPANDASEFDQPASASPSERRSTVKTGASTQSLARVELSPTHSVEFFQSTSGEIAVLEDYDIDLDPGSELGGFRTRRDSYAALYRRLAGASTDEAVLKRLETADARPQRPAGKLPKQPLVSTTPAASTAQDDAAKQTKSVAEDWLWFEGQICLPRQAQANEDWSGCDGQGLAENPNGGWTQDWHIDDYETVNLALFNAHESDSAHLTSLGTRCGFLELGLCSGLVFNEITAAPRHAATLVNESDDGFDTHVEGTRFAVHYLFWD
jgi:hypothetical protein